MRSNANATTLLLAAALLLLPVGASAATFDCDRSESRAYPSPDKRWTASVQEQVCATEKGAAAGITVIVAPPATPLEGGTVVTIAVPRSREDWPRAVWRDARHLEVWVPNMAHIVAVKPGYEDVEVTLKYCGDNPDDRARVAEYQTAVKRWMQDVTAWVERRKAEPELAGPRPVRPEEPRVPTGRCDPAAL